MPDQVLYVTAEFPIPSDPFAAAPILTKTGEAMKAAETAISESLGTPFTFTRKIGKAKVARVPKVKAPAPAPAPAPGAKA